LSAPESPPLEATVTTPPTWHFNSEGGSSTVTRTATGRDDVRLPNQGRPGGTVKVPAYGPSSDSCNVRLWGGQAGADEVVVVECYDAAGAPADERFTLTFHGEVGLLGVATDAGYERGLAWADDASAATYAPSAAYSYNSEGYTNIVGRSGVGAYQVSFFGLGAPFGMARGNVR
jgi:hypothetical protein